MRINAWRWLMKEGDVLRENKPSVGFTQKANLTAVEHGWHGFTNLQMVLMIFLIRVNQCYQCYPWQGLGP
jgi:hypothetical protein